MAVIQSGYIPWRGFFSLIRSVDEYILFDDAQYTRRDWRNRNRIKGPHGSMWLSIPVATKGNFYAPINRMEVADRDWGRKHFLTLVHSYARAPYFADYRDELEELYGLRETRLTRINETFIRWACTKLGIETPIRRSSELEVVGKQSERLLHYCLQTGASVYVSGPSAQGYLAVDRFLQHGIKVEFVTHRGYPPYQQVYPPYDPHVSILDLLFSVGAEAES
ncbi:MAG: WbqC family protein, partial [Myxococcales bacterium]|nr:WbqC family protein [Myxococcales bacterium]